MSSIMSSAIETLPTENAGFSTGLKQAFFKEYEATFTEIRVNIHTTKAQGFASHDENRAMIILLVNEGVSIKIEMTTKEDSPMGHLCWGLDQGHNSESKVLVYHFPTPVTVKALYWAIQGWGLNQYLFASDGSGCQFWTYKLLVKLAEDKRFLLPNEALADTWECFQTSYFPTKKQSNATTRVAKFLGEPEWYGPLFPEDERYEEVRGYDEDCLTVVTESIVITFSYQKP